MRSEVLSFPVDILSRRETIDRIATWLRVRGNRPKMVVTAYSEFFVTARHDREFAEVMRRADLITPDGVSVLAAVKFKKDVGSQISDFRGIIKRIRVGLQVGGKILTGRIGETVTGVWLFEELTKTAAGKGWKVFLLGGWDDVSARTAKMLLERFPNLRVAYDPGENRVGTDPETDIRVIKKINAFKPDLLFVSYNPVKQEKWIASHLSQLKSGVVMGVGGTFNEYLGEFRKSPTWMERMGLKWLWRVVVEPRRIGRILRAVVVFPWLVFVSGISKAK